MLTLPIRGKVNDPAWRNWTNKAQIDARIERFKKPLLHEDPARQDGLAFLCVKNMLITGFDAHVLQALYLDRSMKDYELLQAIARVNRPYDHKENGLVVDYYGVARHLKEALAAYSAEDIQGTMTSIKDELPTLMDRHIRVLAVFQERGIPDLGDVDACVNLLRDPAIRHDFSTKLKQFLASLEIVLPRPEALPYVRDAKKLGYINKSASNLYRDPQLGLLRAGYKVRELIDQHIIALGIDPTIPPISILDPGFEKAVEGRASDQAKASEMEHAVRYYIEKSYQEDPIYYKRLSERLEEIIKHFQNNWADMVEALRAFTREVRQGRPQDETGLDPKTQAPFLGILAEESGAGRTLTHEQLTELAAHTIEMVEHIRQEVRAVDFWRNTQAQHILRSWLIRYLDDHNVVPFQRLPALADRLMELARALHTRLAV